MSWEDRMRKDRITLSGEVRRRLLREGFSRTYANRTARELQEHWEEIVEERVADGVSEGEAIEEASRRLGSAETIAEELCLRMRDSSWLGRNPTFGFLMVAL